MSFEIAQPGLTALTFQIRSGSRKPEPFVAKNMTISRLMKRPISKRARDDRSYASLSIDAREVWHAKNQTGKLSQIRPFNPLSL